MRLVGTALLCGALTLSARLSAATWADSADTHPVGALILRECRLEHPLRLASLAARCGVLTVPEDPARPDGASIGLYVAVIPALNRRAAAPPLFLLAGGPGQAATDLYASYASAFARINRNHDIVAVDQRGTGRSAPVTCSYPDDWQADGGALGAELPLLRAATRTCLEHYGERVRYYTTSVAVEDLERVRAALGYTRIDLYGSSYGTRVAELYMRRHPGSTRAVVLDGVIDPQQAIGPQVPFDGERALNLIVARCHLSAGCAAAYPALAQELRELRRRFGPERQMLNVTDPSSGLPLTLEFNRSLLNAALRFLSYSATEAALLPTLIHQAASGDPAPLGLQTVMLARQVGEQLASGMQNSVICSEDEPLFAAAGVDRQELAQTYQGAEQLDAFEEICKLWPRGPVDPDLHRELHSDIPTLLLSGEADPVTPPAAALRAAQGLTQHRSLVLSGEGHGQLATGCVPQLMALFFDDPKPALLDASCLQAQRPPPFFVTLTGPPP
jgi:pimeloyl-ACP methyl ester carboxylesterase